MAQGAAGFVQHLPEQQLHRLQMRLPAQPLLIRQGGEQVILLSRDILVGQLWRNHCVVLERQLSADNSQ